MPPKVYVVQHPQRQGVPLDISDAGRLGILTKPILPSNYNAQTDTDDITDAVEEALRDITEDDYLLCIGDPVIIAIAAIVAARNTDGLVNLLKWNRMLDDNGRRRRMVGHYVPCNVDIDMGV